MAPTRRLVLASRSPARLRVLREAGSDPEVIVSGIDEDAVEASTMTELVEVLATWKAEAVASTIDADGGSHAGRGGAIVVGCDSMLDVDGTAQGKPASEAEAIERLRRLRGHTAVLRTGHCVIDTASDARASAVASTEVHFGTYTDDELAAYVATGEALEVAGAFTLDGRSAPFIDGVTGDPSNVIGLSLPLFRTLLARIGTSVTDLWV